MMQMKYRGNTQENLSITQRNTKGINSMGSQATMNQSKRLGELITAGNNDHIRKMGGVSGDMWESFVLGDIH